MRETSHDDLRYSGQQGEAGSLTVTIDPPTTRLVATYTLQGATNPIQVNQPIPFNLNGAVTVLQLNLDSVPDGGKFNVVVRPVENEPNNECVHIWTQRGSNVFADFRFFA